MSLKRLSVLFALGAALALGACSTDDLTSSPNYDLGYSDGCGTATTRKPGDPSTIHRNDDLYRADEGYAAGWRAGYSACGRQGGPIQQNWMAPGSSGVNSPGPH